MLWSSTRWAAQFGSYDDWPPVIRHQLLSLLWLLNSRLSLWDLSTSPQSTQDGYVRDTHYEYDHSTITQVWNYQTPHLLAQRTPPKNHSIGVGASRNRGPNIPQNPAISDGPLRGEEFAAACKQTGRERVVVEGLQSRSVHLGDAVGTSVHHTSGDTGSHMGQAVRRGHIYWTSRDKMAWWNDRQG